MIRQTLQLLPITVPYSRNLYLSVGTFHAIADLYFEQ